MSLCFTKVYTIFIIFAVIATHTIAEYIQDDSTDLPIIAYTNDYGGGDGSSSGVSPTEPSISEVAVEKALSWLRSQRAQDWGWYNNTPDVLLALQLAPYTELNQIPETTLETQLSTKQMEIEILIMLWRHHEYPLSPGKLAKYTLALNTLCHDPRQFHGHDLIGTLLHHESQRDADFALSVLSACSASAHVRKRPIRRLLDIANSVNDHNIDTVAIVILALKCIVQDHRHRNLQHFVRRPSLGLARQQLPDGGFGNLHATALAMQALQNEEYTINNHWNRTAAVRWLLSHQNENGNFGDIAATTDAILALSWRGLSAIRTLECGHVSDLENHVDIDEGHFKSRVQHTNSNDTEGRNISVTYTLWVGTNVTENYTLTLTIPRNETFYNVMQIASLLDNHFVFEASEWPNGHYVHTLAGYKEEPMGYHYWLLYRVPTVPDPSNPPANQLVAPGGVDDLLVEDGEHYLFWYKKL